MKISDFDDLTENKINERGTNTRECEWQFLFFVFKNVGSLRLAFEMQKA